jgi:hypothetical protein
MLALEPERYWPMREIRPKAVIYEAWWIFLNGISVYGSLMPSAGFLLN